MFEDLTIDQQVGAITDTQGFVYVMVSNEDTDILVLQTCHHSLDIFHGNGVHTGKWFIQQNEFRIYRQRTGDLRSSSFTTGEAVAIVFTNVVKAKLVQQAFQFFTLFGLCEFGHFQYGLDIVFHTQFAENGGFLWKITDTELRPFVHGQLRDLFIIEEYLAFIGLDQTYHHVEGSCLSGAVGTQQAHDLSLVNLYGYMVHNSTAAIYLYQFFSVNFADQVLRYLYKNTHPNANTFSIPEFNSYLPSGFPYICLQANSPLMKVIDHIKQAKDTLISFEILPPLKGKTINSIYDHLDPLMEFKPAYINVTYHRSEHVFKKKADGTFDKVEVRKRPGTVGICAAIMNYYKVDAVPHLICGGFNKRETEDALIDLNFIGVDNVLVLRGDAAKNETTFEPEIGGNRYALDLLKQVINLNNGIYLEEDIRDGFRTNFCIGVAGYPEKHFEAPNLQTDLAYLKAKVEAGAEYVVTQMFFDNQKYFNFVKACRDAGIDIPIIPGLKPITSKKQLSVIPRTFHVDIPTDFSNEIMKCKTDAEVEQVGTEWLLQQSKELKAAGVPVLHYYTLGKPKVIYNAVKELV